MKVNLEPLVEGKPIPVQPDKEWIVTRLIVIPVVNVHGDRIKGKYTKYPANIIVKAFSPGEASAAADQIQANTSEKLWGAHQSPLTSRSTSWTEVPCSQEVTAMTLR